MKVLVVGGTGFVGSRVVAALLDAGHRVASFQRGAPDGEIEGLEPLRGDRNVAAELEAAVAAAAPDVVVDVVPWTPDQARLLVETVGTGAARLVALSSADVYRNYDGFRGVGDHPPDPAPLDEDAPLRETRFPYRGQGLPQPWADDYDKIRVEEAYRAGPLPAVLLRLPAVYGPGDAQHRVGEWLERMAGQGVVRLSREQARWRWTRGYVEDVARAVAAAATRPGVGEATLNVGPESTPTDLHWVRAIARAPGWEGEVVTVPGEELPAGEGDPFDRAYDLALDTRRIRRVLGPLAETDPAEALRETVAWEREIREE